MCFKARCGANNLEPLRRSNYSAPVDERTQAEQLATDMGIKYCVRRRYADGVLIVVPAHDAGYAALGALLWISLAGRLR